MSQQEVWPPLEWRIDPALYALSASGERRRDPTQSPDDAFCAEVGRRLLLAQFDFSHWVLRRVEKVSFASDRRIARRSSIELRVREDAPILVLPSDDDDSDIGSPSSMESARSERAQQEYWLVPLSVMRRRTLVGLDLRDQAGSLRMLGMRFTQKLDESMLRAAAMLSAGGTDSEGALPPRLEVYVRHVVSGTYEEVKKAKQEYHDWQEARASGAMKGDDEARFGELAPYFEDALFAATLERLWHNFTLYALLPKDKGRHHLLQLAFEERVLWRYQKPEMNVPDYVPQGNGARRDVLTYQPLRRVDARAALRERLGVKTTRIRFLTPSAENCASYHFEFTAPTGVAIAEAALLAGRPNDQEDKSRSRPSWDRIVNPGHTVGLHAVEIPNGSLCRAQVDLRIPRRGWLSTLTVSAWAVALVLLTVAVHAGQVGVPGQWTAEQVTNVVLLLVTVTAGAVTYVAQHPAGDVASRMVSGLRYIGVLVLTLPSVAAVLLVYLRAEPLLEHRTPIRAFLVILTCLCVVAASIISWAWEFTRRNEWRRGRPSPWDMSSIEADEGVGAKWAWLALLIGRRQDAAAQGPPDMPLQLRSATFDKMRDELGFDEKSIGVASAEGWHEVYAWNDKKQSDALMKLGSEEHPQANLTQCNCRHVDHVPPA